MIIEYGGKNIHSNTEISDGPPENIYERKVVQYEWRGTVGRGPIAGLPVVTGRLPKPGDGDGLLHCRHG